MKQEIETRFLDVDKVKLVDDLRTLGAEDCGEVKLEEMTFDPKDALYGSIFVRLRKKDGITVFTYKDNQGGIGHPKELEFEISDMAKCAEFLRLAGWQQMRKLEKFRHTFHLEDVTIDIDTWPKIPTYVEFEGPTVESIQKISAQLGFDWEKRCDGDAKHAFRAYGYDLLTLEVVTFDEFR